MEEELNLQKIQSKIDAEWPKVHQFLRKIEPKIQQVHEETNLSTDHSLLLLMLYDGDYQKLSDQYYNDIDAAKKQAGIPLQNQIKPKTSNANECVWCMMTVEPEDGESLECGHLQCRDCWKEYIQQEFRLKHIFPKCLGENCNLKVTQGFIQNLVKQQGGNLENSQLFQQYKTVLGKAIVTKKQRLVACSNSDCQYIFEPKSQMFAEKLIYDLICPNGHQFCYSCGFQPHRPLSCELVNKWSEKAGDGSMLDAFIKDNPHFFRCPKCKRVINYVSGCDQMTCGGNNSHGDLVKGQGCGHVFCWRCFQPWSDHKGGWSGCNKFKPQGKTDEEKDNEKYMHYLQGYEDNRVMKMTRAEGLLEKITNKSAKDNYIEQFEKLGISNTQYETVTDAIKFLIKARKTLKWTYVYGYYKIQDQQRELFEYQQGLFEEGLQILQTLLQEDLSKLFGDSSKQDYQKQNSFFTELKPKITSQRVSTEQFRNNLLDHLEEIQIGTEEYKNIKDQMNYEKGNKLDDIDDIHDDENDDDDNYDYNDDDLDYDYDE